jgi:hypothetical protein
MPMRHALSLAAAILALILATGPGGCGSAGVGSKDEVHAARGGTIAPLPNQAGFLESLKEPEASSKPASRARGKMGMGVGSKIGEPQMAADEENEY